MGERVRVEKADVDFRRAIAVVDALATCDGRVEVAGGEQEQAAGLQETRDKREGIVRVWEVLEDFDHADHIVAIGWLAGEFVEIEDAEAIVGLEEVGVGADVVAREFERAAGEGGAFAEEFEEAASAAAECEGSPWVDNEGLEASSHSSF